MKPNHTLYVYKGFDEGFYKDINHEKLFSVPISVEITELDHSKAKMLPEIFEKINKGNQSFWCTYEEYLVIGEDIFPLYFDVQIMDNNLFHRCFPMLYEVPDKERLVDTFFDEEDVDNEYSEDDKISIIQKYYGKIKKLNNKWYVVFSRDLPGKGYYTSSTREINERKLRDYENADLELSEEEDEFLILTQKLLSGELTKNEILISHSGQIKSNAHQYYNRLLILQELVPSISISLVTKTTDETSIDESEYLRILNKYWGYESFRKLKMYRDVHDPEFKKETVYISQAQIIDDIVKQSLAAYHNQSYKDIFVTSPTGAGKSIMFQIPALYLAENYNLMTIVISPLIGLMTDQVQGMENRNIKISATINSEITPVQKIEIIEKINNGEISILYISPETLLSRSDISQLIGRRTVGLFVIDEAHIVTTWGKAFRSDYWYLGNYLQRLRKEMSFPVATFTATAIYGGIEDMYAETRDSLNLINPISYFGYIKRDDIEVRIKQKKDDSESKFREYLTDKFKILTYRLENYLSKGQKTLVYFPTVSLIHQYREYANIYGSKNLNAHLAYYFGPLAKEQKHSNYLRFKNNESLIMLATKAFGMGIDIPDIMNVYHFAPTGNVCDYVQEIGRAARALDQGYAYFDFLPKDFVHVNRLHGISTIRKNQLVQVMKKVLMLLEQDENRKNARHLLVNAEEFRYIFQQTNHNDANNDDVDNKLKTALLIIEKDFKAKLGYSPLIARPRSLFSTEFFMIEKGIEEQINKNYGQYFNKIREEKRGSFGPIYSLNMKQLWESKYSNYSFPEFKFKFHTKESSLNLPFLEQMIAVLQIQVTLRYKNIEDFVTVLNNLLDQLSRILGGYSKKRKYFTINEFAEEIQNMIGGDKYFSHNLASIVIHSAENYDRIMKKNSNFYNRFIGYNENRDRYVIQNSGYGSFIDSIRNHSKQIFKPANCKDAINQIYEVFIPKLNQENVQKSFVFLGVLEAMGLIVYSVNGGDNPEIFIRINSKFQIERSIQNPQKYQNVILENVHKRHRISVAMLTYLFRNQVSNEVFWEYIEDYFLGKIPDEVLPMID